MQQVLNWITANPAAVMVAGAGVALALVCYLVLRRGSRAPKRPATQEERTMHDALTAGIKRGLDRRLNNIRGGYTALADFDAESVWQLKRARAKLEAGIDFSPQPKVVVEMETGGKEPTVSYTHVARNWDGTTAPKPVPYGSKPDESARPVTRAELEPVLARIAALEKLPAATNPSQISSSVPHGVRAWRDDEKWEWLWDGSALRVNDGSAIRTWKRATAWLSANDLIWKVSQNPDEYPNFRELHGPELQQVYESWVNRSNG